MKTRKVFGAAFTYMHKICLFYVLGKTEKVVENATQHGTVDFGFDQVQ